MSEHSTPRLVLFDLGNVLISLRPLEQVFPFEEMLSRMGKNREQLRHELREFLQADIFDRFERGQAESKEFFAAMAELLPARLSTEELETCYCRILGEEMEGMSTLIGELKERGVRVAGLTDTSPTHMALFDRYPAVRALESVIASCETGRRKPDPDTFRGALTRLGVSPTEVYYTDDKLANVEGARGVGIRADVFQGAKALGKTLGL